MHITSQQKLDLLKMAIEIETMALGQQQYLDHFDPDHFNKPSAPRNIPHNIMDLFLELYDSVFYLTQNGPDDDEEEAESLDEIIKASYPQMTPDDENYGIGFSMVTNPASPDTKINQPGNLVADGPPILPERPIRLN